MGPGSPLPHLRRDWAHPPTSAPGLDRICTGTDAAERNLVGFGASRLLLLTERPEFPLPVSALSAEAAWLAAYTRLFDCLRAAVPTFAGAAASAEGLHEDDLVWDLGARSTTRAQIHKNITHTPAHTPRHAL